MGSETSLPGTSPRHPSVLETNSRRCPHPRDNSVLLRSPPRPFLRPDLAPRCPSFAFFVQSQLPDPIPQLPLLAQSFPPHPPSRCPHPLCLHAPLPLGFCHSEPESMPLSSRPTSSQPVPSHRCPHVRPSIHPFLPRPALTMPSGCRYLHLLCLLCILGASVQPVRGERTPGSSRAALS